MSLAMRKRGRGVGGPAGAPLKRGKPCAPFWAEDRLASVCGVFVQQIIFQAEHIDFSD